jgi:hypothetical protein
MAGNPTAHNATDPWTAYLGFTPPGETAAMLEASGLKVGTVGMNKAAGDTNALTDLAADPAAGQDARLASRYVQLDRTDEADSEAMLVWLRFHGVTGPLPAGVATLPAPVQAALLAREVSRVKQLVAHRHTSFWSNPLHDVTDLIGQGIQGTAPGIGLGLFSRATGLTIGEGANLDVTAFGVDLNGSVGYYATPHGDALVETGGFGTSSGWGADVTVGPSVSNAERPGDLEGPFGYIEVSGGEYVVGSGSLQLGRNSDGRLMWVGYGVAGDDSGLNFGDALDIPGAPVVYGAGASWTWVQPVG